jgi:hypothetical protein
MAFFGIVTLPTPLSPASVPLPPEPGGGGAHSPAGDGLGQSHFRRLEKSLALCLLCAPPPPPVLHMLADTCKVPKYQRQHQTFILIFGASLLFYKLPVSP